MLLRKRILKLRDIARLKLIEQETELKHLKESLDILSTRCSLFEKERNDRAYQKLQSPPTASQDTPSPSPTVSPAFVLPNFPSSASPSTSSRIDSLINLEVLKAVKSHSGNKSELVEEPPKYNSELHSLNSSMQSMKEQFSTMLSTILDTQLELQAKLAAITSSVFELKQIYQTPATILSGDTSLSQPTPLQSPFPDQDDPATTSSPLPASSVTPDPPTVTRKSPKQLSLLGAPPLQCRVKGKPQSLSAAFISEHSPQLPVSGNKSKMKIRQNPFFSTSKVKAAIKTKPKPINVPPPKSKVSSKPKPDESAKSANDKTPTTSTQVKPRENSFPPEEIDLTEETDPAITDPTLQADTSFTIIDSPDVSDSFGDPLDQQLPPPLASFPGLIAHSAFLQAPNTPLNC